MYLTTIQAFNFKNNQQWSQHALKERCVIGVYRFCHIKLPSTLLIPEVIESTVGKICVYTSQKTYIKKQVKEIFYLKDEHISFKLETNNTLITLQQSHAPYDSLIDHLIESHSTVNLSPRSLKKEIKSSLTSEILSQWAFEDIWNSFWCHRAGLGEIALWIEDTSCTEILINGSQSIYCEINGTLIKQSNVFSKLRLERLMTKLIQESDRTVNTKYPLVDFQLKSGERVHITLPPISKSGPLISIRKFKKEIKTLSVLSKHLNLNPSLQTYLRRIVKERRNILISGGTGLGKTTFLNCLLSECHSNDRIIIVEDTTELNPNHPHVLSLQTRNSPHEPDATVTLDHLIRNAMRMRPTRLICGECRGPEAFQLLLAMNSGHPGSMSTLHANTPLEALHRIEIFLSMAKLDIPHHAIRQFISVSLDIIIQLNWKNQTERTLTKISEVTLNSQTNLYDLKTIVTEEMLDDDARSR
jgi:pilus assembly protein CpaF